MISLLYINLGSHKPRDGDFTSQSPRGVLSGAGAGGEHWSWRGALSDFAPLPWVVSSVCGQVKVQLSLKLRDSAPEHIWAALSNLT